MSDMYPQFEIPFMPAQDVPIKVTPTPLQGLTKRQNEVMDLVLAGHPSKNIAVDLGISQRTVENHRAAIMRRTGATSLPALARLAIGADVVGDCVNRVLTGDFKGF